MEVREVEEEKDQVEEFEELEEVEEEVREDLATLVDGHVAGELHEGGGLEGAVGAGVVPLALVLALYVLLHSQVPVGLEGAPGAAAPLPAHVQVGHVLLLANLGLHHHLVLLHLRLHHNL